MTMCLLLGSELSTRALKSMSLLLVDYTLYAKVLELPFSQRASNFYFLIALLFKLRMEKYSCVKYVKVQPHLHFSIDNFSLYKFTLTHCFVLCNLHTYFVVVFNTHKHYGTKESNNADLNLFIQHRQHNLLHRADTSFKLLYTLPLV